MIIKNKKCIVYDIESLKNIFTCTCRDTETTKIITFEISERKNDLIDMCNYFLSEDAYFVGYNNHHYDDVIMNYILDCAQSGSRPSPKQWTLSLHTVSMIIINNNDSAVWKKWKYIKFFKSIDLLTNLYSQALRVGLKEMQITMHFRSVQEFVVDWNKDLPLEDFDRLIKYNINDVLSTEELLNRIESRLKLRIEVESEYGVECLSKDDVNIGMTVLAHEYMRKTGISKKELEAMRSPCDIVDLEKVVLPIVNFKTPVLQNALKRLKNEHNCSPGRKGYIDTFLLGKMKVTIGVGGIHGDCGTCIIVPKEDELLIDEDVASLYPSLMIEHGFYPPHLGPEFIEIYAGVKEKRMAAKAAKEKLKDTMYKFSLNGLSGNLQNEWSWAYSPFTVMQVRINGQLLLLMLAERLLEISCDLKQINTDGILFTVKKDRVDEYHKICREWEKETKLILEAEEFTAFYQLAINDYFGVYKDGSIKQKGFFITDTLLGKGLQPKIIPEAIINYFVHNIPVEETIKECIDIRKFLIAEKTGKQWNVEYDDKPQQRINRFYASESGCYLWKWKMIDTYDKTKPIYEHSSLTSVSYPKTGKQEKSYSNMLKGYGVKLHNTFYYDEDINWAYASGDTFQSIYDVNYNYYILQANKVIEQLKPRQLSLWND